MLAMLDAGEANVQIIEIDEPASEIRVNGESWRLVGFVSTRGAASVRASDTPVIPRYIPTSATRP